MSPERYEQVTSLFTRAAELAPQERQQFLDRECGADEDLRRRVEQLLAADEQDTQFLSEPPADVAAAVIATESPNIQPGQKIGEYEVVSRVGEGGMATVFRALDTKLNRPVALKVLAADVADVASRRRFQREAQLASSLNHPHILTVLAVGEFAGSQYLVTEFVDGGTLETWLATEPRSWKQVIELLLGVADGLAAAHAAGILHRDVKPTNILLTSSGYAKLADFGLAKMMEPSNAKLPLDRMTRTGVIVGTIRYMSPEQAAGKTVDARSDIFSFGLVLYEAFVGETAFRGANELELLNQILHGTPTTLPHHLPVEVRMVIEKALEKDPTDRYQTMRDLVVDLRRAARDPASVKLLPEKSRPRQLWLGISAVTAALLLGALAGWWLHSRVSALQGPQVVDVKRFTDMPGLEETPAISPDGKAIAFVSAVGGKRQIWVRLLAGGAPLAITKGDIDHYEPRWSADSATLIYYTPGEKAGDPSTIWEIPTLGGQPRKVTTALGAADLSHDGKRLAFFRTNHGRTELVVADRDLSGVHTITALPDGSSDVDPRWSPDDTQIAFKQNLAGAYFNNTLMVASLSGVVRRVPADMGFHGFTWARDRSALIASTSEGSTMSYPPTFNLWVVPLERGERKQLTFGEVSYEYPDLDLQGNLVASRLRAHSDVWKFPVTGTPEENARRGVRITNQTGVIETLTTNPDGSEVAFLADYGGHANVWTARTADGSLRAVTQEFNPRVLIAVPYWSPRGDWINYLSNRNASPGKVTLWVTRPDGTDARDLGVKGIWACWSPDGRWLYYSDQEKGTFQMKKVPVEGGAAVTVRTDNAVGCGLAPDGSGLYYLKFFGDVTSYDFEIRLASPEDGPSTVIGRVAGARIPGGEGNMQAYPSPNGKWLAMPLLDGTTTNLWGFSTVDHHWRQFTNFRSRNVMITRRIGWSRDGNSIYASVSDIDSDIVRLVGLR